MAALAPVAVILVLVIQEQVHPAPIITAADLLEMGVQERVPGLVPRAQVHPVQVAQAAAVNSVVNLVRIWPAYAGFFMSKFSIAKSRLMLHSTVCR